MMRATRMNKRLMIALGTFMIGGFIYCVIELLYRGYTDISMYVLAGFCSIIMAGLNNIFSFNMPFWLQVLLASASCIGGEYVTGMLVNQDFSIWDYRNLPLTFANGQLNAIFCLAWVGISIIGIPLLDYVEWRFMKSGEKPYYIINKKKIYLY